ncbi:MAG: hypothetical protein IJ021_08860 [Clostridia bacterium]|nr:hypothetical protein [Clostridia bacterium]
MEFERFKPLFKLIESEMQKRERTVLAIDGAAASGKSTLAAFLAEKYGAETVHMDDFFLPHERKTPARLAEFDGNIDRERFAAEVLPYIREAKPFSYGKYDCSAGAVLSRIELGTSRLAVVEGVYSLSPCFERFYDIKIMLTISKEEQLARLEERCAPWQLEKFKSVWLPLEERYFTLGGIREKCDIVF